MDMPDVSRLDWRKAYEGRRDNEQKDRIYTGINNPFYGKKHSKESLIKMSNFQKYACKSLFLTQKV